MFDLSRYPAKLHGPLLRYRSNKLCVVCGKQLTPKVRVKEQRGKETLYLERLSEFEKRATCPGECASRRYSENHDQTITERQADLRKMLRAFKKSDPHSLYVAEAERRLEILEAQRCR